MVHASWATAALITVLTTTLQANALIFELVRFFSVGDLQGLTRHFTALSHPQTGPEGLDATREWLRVSTSVDSKSDYEYSDGPARTLAASTYANTTGMTVESCISFCVSGGYIYAGLEYSQVRTLIWDLRSEFINPIPRNAVSGSNSRPCRADSQN
jgi:hypothetical protein